VTFAEAILAPLAGALVGYATFGILATIIAALAGSSNQSLQIPADNWEEVGFGAAVLAGTLLFVGYLYGGFVAGRLAGAGRMGRAQGLLVFVAGVGLAIRPARQSPGGARESRPMSWLGRSGHSASRDPAPSGDRSGRRPASARWRECCSDRTSGASWPS